MSNPAPVIGVCVFVTLLGVAISATLWSGPADPANDDAAAKPVTVTVDMVSVAYSPTTITVPVGSTVVWKNLDPFGHTVTPTDKPLWGTQGSGDAPSAWLMKGDSWSFTFTKPGTYSYYCIPHAALVDSVWQGMVGTVIVSETASAPDETAAPGPALPVNVQEIGRDPADVPAPLQRGPGKVTVDLSAEEVIAEMADGTTFPYWTFNGTVPGPMLRVVQGDEVTLRLHNLPASTTGHNIDLHAVTGPGGGAALTDVAPGQTAEFTFKALNAGLYVYHCAFQDPALHIAHGMYGMILVEPPGGLPAVDKEFYVVQGDFYTPFGAADQGHHPHDAGSAADENPTFVVFNGRVGSLSDRTLKAEVNDTVRIFVGNGGPNLVSSFHVIGEIFDRVYAEASLDSPPLQNVQTTLVPAGGAVMVEFKVDVPGQFFLVDHSLSRLQKGAFGILEVSGPADPSIYRSGP